jgi:GNAT superfamily N-acetyltransferase
VIVRPACPQDAAAITSVQIPSWHDAYRGIVPKAYLQNMLTYDWRQRRIEHWTRTMTGGQIFGVVAEDEAGRVIGFGMGGDSRDPALTAYDAELYALYLLPKVQRQGVGRALFRAFAAELHARTYQAMLIWALRDNAKARGFYERMGGQVISKKLVTLGDPLWEIGYGWPTLAGLVASFGD